MSFAIAHSRCIVGSDAVPISVEAHIANGLPAFTIVGLPETAVRESRDRVRSALINSGFEFPQRRITVNLAPGDIPKDGTRFDLAIAVAILAASGQLPVAALAKVEFVAELALDGALRPTRASLAAALACRAAGRDLCTGHDDAAVACLIDDAQVYAADDLGAVVRHLLDVSPLSRVRADPPTTADARVLRGPILGDVTIPRARRARRNRPPVRPQPPDRLAQPAWWWSPRLPGILRQACTGARRCRPLRAVDRWDSRRIQQAGANRPTAHPIIRARPRPWSVVDACRARVKFRLRTTACCFSTNCPSSNGARWKPCANHSNSDG